MKIYTKQGDKGRTAVYTDNLIKVDKDDLLIECYGTLDELNSQIGLSASLLEEFIELRRQSQTCDKKSNVDESVSRKVDIKADLLTQLQSTLVNVQQSIFKIGFGVSANEQLSTDASVQIENMIDAIQNCLPPQTHFILPGGTVLAAHLHVARTVARRAERSLVSVSKQQDIHDASLVYLNRLSDLLFCMARYVNHVSNIDEIKV